MCLFASSLGDCEPTRRRSRNPAGPDQPIYGPVRDRPAEPAVEVSLRSDDRGLQARHQYFGVRIVLGFGWFGHLVPATQWGKVPGCFVYEDQPVADESSQTLQAVAGPLQPCAIPAQLELDVLAHGLAVLCQVYEQLGVIAGRGFDRLAHERIDET